MKTSLLRLSFALIACFSLIGCASTPYYEPAMVMDRALPEQPARAEAGSTAASFATVAADPATGDDVKKLRAAHRASMIYTAELGLRVDRVDAVQTRAERLVAEQGGYIGEASPGRLVIRIPAEVFDETLDALAALGEVTARQVRALDAAERVVDLESRLRSASVMRDRLIVLIERAEDIEHALKAEQELARVSEQIEIMQGRLRLLKQQIAYSTITLSITPTPAEQRLTPGIPIAWVRDIGNVFRERSAIDVSTPRRLRDGVDVDLPEGFIRYYQEAYVTQAIDANGVRIRVRRFKNFDDGPLKFWEQLVLRSLDENGRLDLQETEQVAFERGGPGRLIKGAKTLAGEEVRHLVALGVSDDGDYVYCFEAWGVARHVDAVLEDIKQSINTMRCY